MLALKVLFKELVQLFLLDWRQRVHLHAKHLSVWYEFNGMVPFLAIWEFVEGLFGEHVFELLVRFGHYIFEARGVGPFCGFRELLGYHLSGLDLCRVFVNEACKKLITSIQIVWVWACESWWRFSLIGFCLAFGDLFDVHLPTRLHSWGAF